MSVTSTISSDRAGATGTVLVVDDDAVGRSLMVDWLTAYGHTVLTAGDGIEALRKVEEHPPDAILLDVMMPGMDGFTVCEKLKADPKTAAIPVLMLTALHEREDRMRGMQAGANDFLLKPADLPYVLLRVRNSVRLKRLGDEAKQRIEEMRKLEQFKDDLVHMVVHDLRTPLAGLDGFLQMLQMSAGSSMDGKPAHYLRQAIKAAGILSRQVDLLLDIQRIEEGQMPVQAVVEDLTEIINRTLAPLRSLIAERKVELKFHGQPLTAVCDPMLLSRVITNLVGNAIAFTSPEHGEITIQGVPADGRARIEVVDNGPGIDPDHHDKIFEKFHQAPRGLRERSSGLGLAFCKLALEAQNGRIGVISEPGKGSRFWFELPAVTAA